MPELSQAHIDKITAMRVQTYAHVTAHMPEWRQLKWNQYISYYDRCEGNTSSMRGFEVDVMNTMLNSGETYKDGYERAITGLSWLSRCIVYHDQMEKEVMRMFDAHAAEFDITAMDYPNYPLDSI